MAFYKFAPFFLTRFIFCQSLPALGFLDACFMNVTAAAFVWSFTTFNDIAGIKLESTFGVFTAITLVSLLEGPIKWFLATGAQGTTRDC